MTTEFPAIDRDKSPLLDADHDAVRIAEALRRSPHIHTVDDVAPGDEAVWFRDASGVGHTISLTAVEPIMTDEPQGEAYVCDAVAAAIGNHQDFVNATYKGFGADRLETITALTRTGHRYTLTRTFTPWPRSSDIEEPSEAVADLLSAVGQLRARLEDDPVAMTFNAAADLLEHIAGTWDQQDNQTRQRAYILSQSL